MEDDYDDLDEEEKAPEEETEEEDEKIEYDEETQKLVDSLYFFMFLIPLFNLFLFQLPMQPEMNSTKSTLEWMISQEKSVIYKMPLKKTLVLMKNSDLSKAIALTSLIENIHTSCVLSVAYVFE